MVNLSDQDNALRTLAFRQRPEETSMLGDRYLVRELDVANVSEGGVILPDTETLTSWRAGLILAVGDGHRLEVPDQHAVVTLYEQTPRPEGGYTYAACGQEIQRVPATVTMAYKVGDIITFERMTGREIPIGGKKLRIISQTAVFFRFEATVDPADLA